jgi:hypothetical protein
MFRGDSIRCLEWAMLFLVVPCAHSQGPGTAEPAPESTGTLSPTSLAEKWNFFATETVTPLTLAATGLDATASQLTRSAPLYGKHFWRKDAYWKRFGATVADTVSQNFFADFLLASALHEDTRYIREGHSRGLWSRAGYALSRAVVTRTDSGAPTFNWAVVLGCAMSAGLSNAYYPDVSRTPAVASVNWATNLAGAGLTNLVPEFGSDVRHWFKRHLHFIP